MAGKRLPASLAGSCLLAAFLLGILPPRIHAQKPPVERILAELTLEQRIAQMFMVSVYGPQLNEKEALFLREIQPGALALFSRNVQTPAQLTRLTNAMQAQLTQNGAPPMLIAADQEGGRIQRLLAGFTRFPGPMLLTAAQDEALAYELGAAIAAEMRAVGVNMNLAPVADLQGERRNPVLAGRSFGGIPGLVAPMLSQFIAGAQDQAVLATVKHFPGHGGTDQDSHLTLPTIRRSQEQLRSRELLPFQAAFAADVAAVMVAHIHYQAYDSDVLPASLSPNVMTRLLREELGYDGLILTDALDMDAIDRRYSLKDAVMRAIKAGSDVIVFGPHSGLDGLRSLVAELAAAVRRGEIPARRIAESASRILRAKRDFGILDQAPLDPATVASRLNLEAHEQLVTRLFKAGITVLDARGLLPLPGNTLFVYPATRPRIRSQCQLAGADYLGVSWRPQAHEIEWARGKARKADRIVVFTQGASADPRQQALVNALPADRTIVAALWDPFDLLAFPRVEAFAIAYSPMLRASGPLCQILLGPRRALGALPLEW